jgi:hypothetical protein
LPMVPAPTTPTRLIVIGGRIAQLAYETQL